MDEATFAAILAALPEVRARLDDGGSALDVGCGTARATIALARAHPNARVLGLDARLEAIEEARRNAAAADLGGRLLLEVADCTRLPTRQFTLVTVIDVLGEAARPAALLAAVRGALTQFGVAVVVDARQAIASLQGWSDAAGFARTLRLPCPDPRLAVLLAP